MLFLNDAVDVDPAQRQQLSDRGVRVAGSVSDVRAPLLSAAASGLTAGEALTTNLVMADRRSP